MEVSLRKPQREVFILLKEKHPGGFLRKHKKSLSAKRSYFRLMTKDGSPVKNIRNSDVKPMLDADVLEKKSEFEYMLKPGITLHAKVKKEKKK